MILAVVVAAGSGAERGFWLTFTTYGGAMLGILGGAALAPHVSDLLNGSTDLARAYAGVLTLLVAAVVGSSLGYAVGEPIRAHILSRGRAHFDTGFGVALSAVATLATTWFLGLSFSQGPIPPLSEQLQHSYILLHLDEIAPRPPAFLAEVQHVLSAVKTPTVCASLSCGDNPNDVTIEPGAYDTAAVRAAAGEVVKVESQGCGGLLEGSGFPVAQDVIVTNAHVVAGGSGTVVHIPNGKTLPATVVLFDPHTDIAILHVTGLHLAPIPGVEGNRGMQGAVIGYPGGGHEAVKPAAVRSRLQATGRDIYGQDLVTREIFILNAQVIPGNSGGPLVDTNGHFAGVVFAASTTDPNEAYALTLDQVNSDINSGANRTSAVSTQSCAD
ncbi:MAG: MarP family serine protease [Candidatus Dormibacteria bacterium]